MKSFEDLGISRSLTEVLAERGITAPFPTQELIVPDVLAGRDVLLKAPTGSGKTLAFGIPLVQRIASDAPRPGALVLAPTRELASQIVDELRGVAHARALVIAAVYGGAGIERQAKLVRRAHIVVATPGRLEDLIARGHVDLGRVRVLVLDEADRMLDMGFRPAVDRIVRQTPEQRQTIFLSATLDGEAGRLANLYTRQARRLEHAHPPARATDVEHRFVRVSPESKLEALVRELHDPDRGLALVFVRTKRGADRLVKRLGANDVRAVAMHGNKSQSQREKALARFEAGRVDTLVATDVAARGIDVEGITHVINFDAPEDREGYVHRIGRTGRAGRRGVGVTFVAQDQTHAVGAIARELAMQQEWRRGGFGRQERRGGARR